MGLRVGDGSDRTGTPAFGRTPPESIGPSDEAGSVKPGARAPKPPSDRGGLISPALELVANVRQPLTDVQRADAYVFTIPASRHAKVSCHHAALSNLNADLVTENPVHSCLPNSPSFLQVLTTTVCLVRN